MMDVMVCATLVTALMRIASNNILQSVSTRFPTHIVAMVISAFIHRLKIACCCIHSASSACIP